MSPIAIVLLAFAAVWLGVLYSPAYLWAAAGLLALLVVKAWRDLI